MKGIFSLAGIRGLLGGDKKLTVLLIAGAFIIFFLAFGGLKSGSSDKSGGSVLTVERQTAYEAGLEKRLSVILSEIEGVGELKVMVTLDTSEQTEYGKNEGMLLGVKMPQVKGVIVVCSGGDSVVVQEKVIRAVSGIFGISSTHISVMK